MLETKSSVALVYKYVLFPSKALSTGPTIEKVPTLATKTISSDYSLFC